MIELIEIKAAANSVVRNAYPDMKVYGPDTTGALDRPSFYTEIVPYTLQNLSVNLVKQSCGLKVTLMEKVTDEDFQLGCFARLRKAFGLKLLVKHRKITISDIEFDYIGKKNDVFQITIRFEWYDSIAEPEKHELMNDVHTVFNERRDK